MLTSVIKSTISGIIGGLLLGVLVGGYVVVQTRDTVIDRDAYKTSLLYEQAEVQYVKTTVSSFAIVFAFVGAWVDNATFGSWLSPAVYGVSGTFAVLVVLTVLAAAVTGQQPVNMHKGATRSIIDCARTYGVPMSVAVGPFAGILYSRWKAIRRRGIEQSTT
jgi:hypothetical protein